MSETTPVFPVIEKSKGGRPPHQPSDKDRQMVEALAGFAIPTAKIADVIDIDQKTLLRHYERELRVGAAKVEAKLAGNLLRLAGGSDGTALKAIMFALNCRFGWSQYVPRPVEEKLGKKEIAQIEAETAHETSKWARYVQ
jgi:hypothetical protein